ncbi:unnamed protein product [Effrenium voratum]|nr:unnamed protein product [Effrenium voratum]
MCRAQTKIKSAASQEYSFLQLENGLKAILGSDPECDKAGAALCVNVGMCHERKDLPGLAHFLEHMLFTGTAKYPKEGDYHEFIQQNGGLANAYTACYFTNYMFEIKPESLTEALDRFSRFFTEPLLTRDCTEREINAVDSEFQAGLTSPWWRYVGILNMSANPDHPFHVAVGNNKVLLEDPKERGIDLYEEMKKLYESTYSSNGMTLCVFGKEPTAELRQIVRDKFGPVVNKGVDMPVGDNVSSHLPFKPSDWHQLLLMNPVQDVKDLTFSWVIPYQAPLWRSKPVEYISHLLGHEGKGSVIAALKQKGLISACTADNGAWLEGAFSLLNVTFELTDKGLDSIAEIGRYFFAYLGMLQNTKPEKCIFDEMQKLGEIGFKFKEDASPFQLCPDIALSLLKYPPSEALCGTTLHYEFDPDGISQLLSLLTLDKVRVQFQAKVLADRCTQKDTSYGSPIELLPLEPAWLEAWAAVLNGEVAGSLGLNLPQPNPFIPEDLSLKPPPAEPQAIPVVLKDPPVAGIVHRQDDTFQQPKAHITFFIYAPYFTQDALNYTKTELWCRCVEEALQDYAYDAGIAGVGYGLGLQGGSLRLAISGFNDKLHVLLDAITEKMTSLKTIPEHIFGIVSDTMGDDLNNQAYHSPPYRQASKRLEELLTRGCSFPVSERLEAFKSVTIQDLSDLCPRFFAEGAHVEVLALGNLTSEDAKQLSKQLVKGLHVQKGLAVLPGRSEAALPEGRTLWELPSADVDDPNHCVAMKLQQPESLEQEMLLGLLDKALSAKFFDILRTQQQLGYIVHMSPSVSLKMPALAVLVQTEFNPDYVRGCIVKFLEEHLQQLEDSFSEEELSVCKAGYLSQLRMKPKNLGDEAMRYTRQIFDRSFDFGRRARGADFVEAVTLRDLKAFARSCRTAPAIFVQIKKQLAKEDKALPAGATIDPPDMRRWTTHMETVKSFATSATWFPVNSSVDASKHAGPDGFVLTYKGDVFITGCQITSDAGISIDASGGVTVEYQSALQGQGDVVLRGSSVSLIQSTVSVPGALELLSNASGSCKGRSLRQDGKSADDAATVGIQISDSSLQGGNIKVSANQSDVEVKGSSNLTIKDPTAKLEITGNTVLASGGTATLSAAWIVVSAAQDMVFEVAIPGIVTKTAEKPAHVDVAAQGHLTLGNCSSTWSLSRLHASADSLELGEGSKLNVQSYSTCGHRGGSSVVDRCRVALAATQWPPIVNDSNVSFDLVLLARTSLTIHEKAQLQAASVLVCSASVALEDFSSIDVSGRGCSANIVSQPAAGRTIKGPDKLLLAGGGTHVGRGGDGGWFNSRDVLTDTDTVPETPEYDRYKETPWLLPTQGASAGAIGEMSIWHKDKLKVFSAGGGLIWLSGLNGVSFGKTVRLNADGKDGLARVGDASQIYASAGGAGGQVLLFAGGLKGVPPDISAAGGKGACIKQAAVGLVSGGGGGGFVGLNWTRPTWMSHLPLSVSVAGGGLGVDQSTMQPCSFVLPQTGKVEATRGSCGQALSVLPCPPGSAGLFCAPCGAGLYSLGGLGVCQTCKPIPERGHYVNITGGCVTSSCPYSCGVGVPNVASNPSCLDPVEYALSFFGGLKGMLGILAGIVFTASLLLWRRRKTSNLSRPLIEVREVGTGNVAARLVNRCLASQCEMFQVSREHLPFHICRVYLQGENTAEVPWHLRSEVPVPVQDLVIPDRWQALAKVVNEAAHVPRFSARCEALLWRLYPPLAPPLARRFRLSRAGELLRAVAEQGEATERLWKPIRLPGGELFVRFGCDAHATLAHLDFLDFELSRLDWAPVNLQKEAWLIPVQGHGTFAEPFAVDIGDPVLQRLEHTNFGPTAVLSVISTFNRAARRICKDDLHSSDDDSLQELHEKVEQCAAQCGLAGCVQVLAIASKGARERSTTRSSTQRSSLTQESPAGSFIDLVGEEQEPGSPSRASGPKQELRLCLVFTQFSSLASISQSSDCGGGALATPSSHKEMNDILRSSAGSIGEASPVRTDQACGIKGLQRMLLKWGSVGSHDATIGTLVSLTCLLALDLMAFVLVFWILYKTSSVAGFVWICFPPLVQPLALVLGPLFLLSEDPDLGRLFALLELFGACNAAFSLLVMVVLLLLDSLLFDIVAMAVVICIKAMLFSAAGAHVAQLEAANDLSFMGTPQSDFVAGIFARSSGTEDPGLHDSVHDNSPTAAIPSFQVFEQFTRQSSDCVQRPDCSFPATGSTRSARSTSTSTCRIQAQAPSPF